MTGPERKTGRRRADDLLIAALAGGTTVEAAAAAAGTSTATVYRRLREPAFRAEVASVRRQRLDAAAGRLAEATSAAVNRLQILLGAEAQTVQLGAARSVLEWAVRLREAGELEERLAALERQAAGDRAGQEG